jgi:acyl dehydratase
MNQRLRDGARTLGRAEAVLVFWNVFGDLQRIVADRAKAGCDFFGSVIVHGAIVNVAAPPM